MILHPGKFIERFMDAGGDVITFHIEVLDDPISLINTIRERDKKVGIALNPDTPISKVCNFLDLIDTILIMTVNPGFSGQNFMKCVIPKIKFLKEDIIQRKLNLTIEVDGGIKEDNIYSVVEAGADIVVSGSGVFGGGDPGGAIRVLKERAKEGFRKSRMGIL
jgi:ribulose-phosphate 3-epimerase